MARVADGHRGRKIGGKPDRELASDVVTTPGAMARAMTWRPGTASGLPEGPSRPREPDTLRSFGAN